MNARSTCPACGAGGFASFYDAGSVPLRSSIVLDDVAAATSFPAGRLVLSSCASCGFVGNSVFDAHLSIPAGTTEDQQVYSPTFAAYSEGLARDIVDRYGLRGKRVVEIGCGRGDFLARLCAMGKNDGVGVDPLFRDAGGLDASPGTVTAVAEAFDASHARFRPDVIVCRHTLEHIPDPAAFLRTVRATLDDVDGAAVVIEVPDVVRVFEEAAFWDVYYEHCSYFSPGSLARTLRTCGFEVVDLQRVYDGQYIVVHARAGSGSGTQDIEEAPRVVSGLGRRFAESVTAQIESWKGRLSGSARRPVALWGSGSKCVAFMAALGGSSAAVAAIVDINPRRHGRYMPGISLPVMPPEHLARLCPGTVVAMNPIYRDEIEERVRGMGLDAEVVAV